MLLFHFPLRRNYPSCIKAANFCLLYNYTFDKAELSISMIQDMGFGNYALACHWLMSACINLIANIRPVNEGHFSPFFSTHLTDIGDKYATSVLIRAFQFHFLLEADVDDKGRLNY